MTESIVHLTDLHFWNVSWNPFSYFSRRILGMANVLLHRAFLFKYAEAQQLVNRVAELKPSLVLLTGDLTSTSLEKEFAQARRHVDVLRSLGFRTAVFPGNHDRYTFTSKRKRTFEKYFGDVSNNGSWPYLERLSERLAVILLDQARPNVLSARGFIGGEQIAACEKLVGNECRDTELLIVAGHYPLFAESEFYHLRPDRRLIGAESLRKSLGGIPKPVLYVFGHVHSFSYGKDPDYPNLTHLSSRAPFKLPHPGGRASLEFSRITLSRDGFSVERHYRKNGDWTVMKMEL